MGPLRNMFKAYSLVLAGLFIFGFVAVYAFHVKTISAETYSYLGAVLGGVFAGIFTLVGVLYTLQAAKDDSLSRDAEKREYEVRRRVNLTRLMVGELKQNQDLLQHMFQHKSWKRTNEMSFSLWNRINVDLDWIDSQLFNRLYEMYATFKMMHEEIDLRTNETNGGSILADHLDGRDNWRGYIHVIDQIITDLEKQKT